MIHLSECVCINVDPARLVILIFFKILFGARWIKRDGQRNLMIVQFP